MSVAFARENDDGTVVRDRKDFWAVGQNHRVGELEVAGIGTLAALLPSDRVVFGPEVAVKGAPTVADPVYGWYTDDDGYGEVALLKSFDGTDELVYATANAATAELTLGSADVAVLFAGAVDLDASWLTSGTVPSARLAGAYTGITGVGTLASLAVTGNVDVGGAYRVDGTQVLTNRQTGWGAPTGVATRTTFDTATVTLPQLAERLKALIDDFLTHGAIGT